MPTSSCALSVLSPAAFSWRPLPHQPLLSRPPAGFTSCLCFPRRSCPFVFPCKLQCQIAQLPTEAFWYFYWDHRKFIKCHVQIHALMFRCSNTEWRSASVSVRSVPYVTGNSKQFLFNLLLNILLCCCYCKTGSPSPIVSPSWLSCVQMKAVDFFVLTLLNSFTVQVGFIMDSPGPTRFFQISYRVVFKQRQPSLFSGLRLCALM